MGGLAGLSPPLGLLFIFRARFLPRRVGEDSASFFIDDAGVAAVVVVVVDGGVDRACSSSIVG